MPRPGASIAPTVLCSDCGGTLHGRVRFCPYCGTQESTAYEEPTEPARGEEVTTAMVLLPSPPITTLAPPDEEHDAQPPAFTTGVLATESTASDTVAPPLPAAAPLRDHQAASQPLQKVAEPRPPPDESTLEAEHVALRLEPVEFDREDLVCRIRKLFGEGEERERESALAALAHELGQHAGTRVLEELDNALRTAVRRGILANEHGALRLFARTIDQYDRDALKEQLLASLPGGQWVERKDAIRNFARWMGFRRTGATIDDTARSLLNGLLREERLERDASRIRRIG